MSGPDAVGQRDWGSPIAVQGGEDRCPAGSGAPEAEDDANGLEDDQQVKID